MRLSSRISLTLALLLACIALSRAAGDSHEVLKILVDSPIHPIVAEQIDRAIQEANRSHAEALLIDLKTPGGLYTSTRDIIHSILSSPVPVIIYVTPSGGWAASAGFFILESADVAAMAPGTNAGASHPVRGDGGTMDPVMKEKVENDAAALMRSYAGKRGHNVEVAESAVRQSKSFSADEALSQHLIDYIAKDEQDLFRQLDGKTITRFDGSKSVLHLSGVRVRVYEMTLREQILSGLMNPNTTLLLLAVGLLAIYFEFNHPGAVIPGVVGFVAVLLAIYALNLLPFRSIALVLIISAFVLFALEAKFQSHGALAVAGVVLMVLGSLLLVDGPIPQMRVKLVTALSISIPLGGITVFLMTIALKAQRNKVVTGEQGLIGEIGVVQSPLIPKGKVLLRGALWDAVSAGNLDVGEKVVVRNIENLVLHVEPLPASQGTVLNAAKV
ncbi:MAG TPA: nodulation protein NfeD [Terriglobales bacterium]|nr:nodulation protein NfeD [Terriglobales bacterium]